MKSFIILFVFSLYLQTLVAFHKSVSDNRLTSAKKLTKFRTWAQKRTLTQDRMTINNTFTDQMTESIKDIYKVIERNDLIRKVLMYDKVKAVHRALGQKIQVSFEKILGHMANVQRLFLESKQLTENERSVFKQSISKWDSNGYLNESIRTFGRAEQKIVDIPEPKAYYISANFVEYIMKSGSITAMATALMAQLGIQIDIYRHLENSPDYRKNDLAINFLIIGIGLEEFITDLEYFVDKKGESGLSKDEKDKLMILYRDVFRKQWNVMTEVYKSVLGAVYM